MKRQYKHLGLIALFGITFIGLQACANGAGELGSINPVEEMAGITAPVEAEGNNEAAAESQAVAEGQAAAPAAAPVVAESQAVAPAAAPVVAESPAVAPAAAPVAAESEISEAQEENSGNRGLERAREMVEANGNDNALESIDKNIERKNNK